MEMSVYAMEVRAQTRTNCVQAIGRLEEQMKSEQVAHFLSMFALEARVEYCKATIARIDSELEKRG